MAFTYGEYNGKKLDDLSGAERRAYEASVTEYQAQVNKQAAIDSAAAASAAKATGTTDTGTTDTGTTDTGTTDTDGETTVENPFVPPEFGTGTVDATPMQSKLDKINQELADLYTMDQTDPAVIKAIEDKTKEQQTTSAAAVTEGQQNLVSTAIKTPQDLLTKATVAKIDPDTIGAEISSDLNKVPQYDAAGNPLLDAEGNPVLGPSQANVATASKAGVPQYDAAGNPLLDADGNPVLGAAQTDAPDDIETEKYTASTSIGDATKALEGGEFIDGASLVEKAAESSPWLKDAKYNKEKGTVTYLRPNEVLMGFREDGSPYPQTFSEVEVPLAEFAERAGISLDDYTTQVDGLKTVKGDDPDAIEGATADVEELKGKDIEAAQINAEDVTQIVKPAARKLDPAEVIEGSAVEMARVKAAVEFTAAQADPSKQATVRGQMEELQADFEGGQTPAWAAGALRNVSAQMAARGLGASSMAGQALVQAAMEAALPIAQVDAATFSKFEFENLSNRQATAMFAAEQRAKFLGQEFDEEFQTRVRNAATISDIANQNFTAEQSIALENAKLASTANIANLSARNAKVLADAAAVSNMEISNLNNQQQAKVENAKNLLQMDMTNLNNEQQTEIFKAQAIQASILSDQAAENVAKQFGAESENETNQVMAKLAQATAEQNTSQKNLMEQFNAGEENAIAKHAAEQKNAREEFNSEYALEISKANALWRQNTTTVNTAEQNEANRDEAKAANEFTAETLDQIWQRDRDLLSYAWQSSNNALDRLNDVILANITASASASNAAISAAAQTAAAEMGAWGQLGAGLLGLDFD
jgi:hypothetical protein